VENFFEVHSDSVASRVAIGLDKLGLALKSQAWAGAGARGLTPTQGQILALLRARGTRPLRLTQVAEELAITAPTASDSVRALVEKGFISKARAKDDARAVALELTSAGRDEAEWAARWHEFLLAAVDALSDREQEAFLLGLIKIIHALIERGQIPMQRMCVTCRYFQPNVRPTDDPPHRCLMVDAPLRPKYLRLECAVYEPAEPEVRRQRLKTWTAST
jgi:DNA-binding MarR family transcriptional regulator